MAQASSGEGDWHAIDESITAKMQIPHIPGIALAIVKGDQIVYLKGYGQADSSGRPVTPQTPFLIGSISKSFTALAVMQLVEEGLVHLDAPVQQYIPWFRVADQQVSAHISVRQLLNQTSGLPQVYETQLSLDQDDSALERTVRSLSTVSLSHPMGTFGYSNANYDTLGVLVQTVSGQSYENYVKHHIFAPLTMQTSFVSQEEARLHGMASGYRWWFGVPVPVILPYNRASLPSGYIISSAEDMAHFLIAQMNGGRYGDVSVLSSDGIALMHTELVKGTYGMGWESVQINGRTLLNHDGGTANFQASMFFDPKFRVGVFLAANVINALDAFSSPPGSAPLDGPTTRAMAISVLSLVTNQPLPDQGVGIVWLTLLFDLVVVALTTMLLLSLMRMPGRYRWLAQRGLARWSALAWCSMLLAALHFALPFVVLYLALNVPAWKVLVLFQPDLGYWLEAVALVVFLKGWLELALTWRAFRHSHQGQILQPG
jgi:CubicO group peptidase (beta-lactamase class C family)